MAGCGGQSSEKLSSRGVGQCVPGTGLPLRDGRVLPPRRRPPVPNVCRWRPRRPRRPVWVGLRTARATTQSSRDRPGATGFQGSSGPHRTSRCAASPSGTVLWRRSVWASSRCVSSASPYGPPSVLVGLDRTEAADNPACPARHHRGHAAYRGPSAQRRRFCRRPTPPWSHVEPGGAAAGLAFVRRTDSEQTGQVLDSYRWDGCAARGMRSRGG